MTDDKPITENFGELQPDCFPFDTRRHVVLDLYRREDGGLRIVGRDDARGLILSAPTPAGALDKVWMVLFALKHPITKHDY